MEQNFDLEIYGCVFFKEKVFVRSFELSSDKFSRNSLGKEC